MKKLLIAATAVLVSSSPVFLLPMEKELTLTPKQVQNLSQNTIASLSQFKQIPKNPRTITNILTYKNKELTEFKPVSKQIPNYRFLLFFGMLKVNLFSNFKMVIL